MFPFDLPKSFGFLMFSEGSKEKIGKKRIKVAFQMYLPIWIGKMPTQANI